MITNVETTTGGMLSFTIAPMKRGCSCNAKIEIRNPLGGFVAGGTIALHFDGTAFFCMAPIGGNQILLTECDE